MTYEGTFIPSIPPDPIYKQKPIWWIIVLCGLIVIVLSSSLFFCYCYRVRKNEKRLNFMIDVIKSQKKLSPDEIVSLKEKRDEFTIQRKKLKIAYEFPIGNGASSSVYLGFLYGISPLTLITRLIETQKFRDCKVAVKVPSSFGFDESEQLFREIETMKKIGYNEHVICMLGICLLNEKPVLVFEMAEKDLLEYVQTFKKGEMLRARSYLNSFFSILWQVAKGKIVNKLNIRHTNRLMADPRRNSKL